MDAACRSRIFALKPPFGGTLARRALSLVEPLARDYPLGKGTRAALEAIRAVIPPALDGDRWYHDEIAAALVLARSGAIVEAVEAAVGPLE